MKKKLLILTGIIVLFMAVGGLWGYNKYFRPDPEIQRQLTDQFGTEFFNAFDDQGSVNNSSVVTNSKSVDDIADKSAIPKVVAISKKTDKPEENQNNTPLPTPVNEINTEKPITQDEISSKYMQRFNYLQNVALGRLDTLYSAAFQEYVQGKKAGTLNRSALAQKYIQAGTMLESSVDNQFYSTLNAMQTELIANNLPTDIVSVIKNNYEKAKSNKRSQLLAKAGK